MLPGGSSYPPVGGRERQQGGPSTPRPGGDTHSPAAPARGAAAAVAAAPRPRATPSRYPGVHVRVRYESLAGQRMEVYRRHKRVYEAGVLVAVLGGGMAAAAVAEERQGEEDEAQAEAEDLSDESAETSSSEGGDAADARVAAVGPVRGAASAAGRAAAAMAGEQQGSWLVEPGTCLMRYDSGEEEELVLTQQAWWLLHPTTGVVMLEHMPTGEDAIDEMDEDYPEDDGEDEDTWVL